MNGTSFYVVCWMLYLTSPCFMMLSKDNLQYKKKHFMLCKKFIMMLCPGQATHADHQHLGKMRRPKILELCELLQVSQTDSDKKIECRFHLRKLISDGKAAAPEAGIKMGRHWFCPACKVKTDMTPFFRQHSHCEHCMLLKVLEVWLNAQEPGVVDQSQEVDSYVELPVLLAGLT